MSLDGLDNIERAATKKKVVGKIAELLDRSGIDVADVGKIQRVNLWQGFHKDDAGDPQVVDLAGIQLSPSWAEGPEWPVVQQAKPTLIKPPATTRRSRGKWKTAVILPDPQIGYRRREDGQFEPFHDVAAINVALKVVGELNPDVIVNLGDTLDLPEWGKYLKEPGFYFTTQPTLDYAHEFLARQRAAAPRAEIHMLEGNHDFRLTKGLMENAIAAFGLRQAKAPEGWPVMSVPHLLRLDELGVQYHSGYPAGEVWINDRLVCIHGIKVRSGGSTASAVVNDSRASTIFGHVHRIELQHKTHATRHGPLKTYAATPGCLCRVDGAVPSVKSGVDVLGRPLQNWENWQQGFAVVTYEEGDGPHSIELAHIQDGRAFFRGEVIT